MLIALTLHSWQLSTHQQHRIIQSLPQPFTIRDLDHYLAMLPARFDAKRSDIAASLIEAWQTGGEIHPVSRQGITQYSTRRAA